MEKGTWEKTFKTSNAEEKPAKSPGADESSTLLREDGGSSWEDEFRGEKAGLSKSQDSSSAAGAHVNGAPNNLLSSESGPPPSESKDKTADRFFSAGLVCGGKSISGLPILSKLGMSLDKIWVNIHLKASGKRPRVFVFCGATPKVGTTFISFHMALSLALERHLKVLYVDAAVDAPDKPPVFPDMARYPGLTSYFAGRRPVDALILKTQYKNLHIVPSGTHETSNGADGSKEKGEALSTLLDYCRANFDVTIFDAQPVMEYPSTIAFARVADQTILICKCGVSRQEVYKYAVNKLRENGVSLAGMILNERQYPIPISVYNLLK